MLSRRIAAAACALCFAVPAAAGASPAQDPPTANGTHGVTAAVPQDVVAAKGPYGVTAAVPQDVVAAKGPYGVTAAVPQDVVAAKGPYGATAAVSQDVVKAEAHKAGASGGNDANDWRVAAISEAALLAAMALGSALVLTARRRDPRLAM
jgi:hypothetical protein